jgi:hypothetical protein
MTTTFALNQQAARRRTRPASAPASPGRSDQAGGKPPVRRQAARVQWPRSRYLADGALTDLCPSSPFRPVDWRFHVALVARECGRSTWVDHDTLRVLDLLQDQGQRAVDDDAISSRLEPYREALGLHQGPDEPVRAVLEAHLLARRSIDDVAKAMSLVPEVVRVYESAFFNVADRLNSPSYIAHHALRRHRPPQPTLAYVLREQAYAGGPLILDDLLRHFGLGHFAMAPPHEHVNPVLHDVSVRLAIAALLLPASPRAMLAMTELGNRYERLQRLGDPERHQNALQQFQRAQVKRLRRMFGAAAIRKHPFLAQMLAYNDHST